MGGRSGWYFWSSDFWGNPLIRRSSTANKMRLVTVIDAANGLDSPEISDAVINTAALQLGEKPSQIREALQKLRGLFKLRDDGTPYLGKIEEKLRDSKLPQAKRGGGNGVGNGVNVGAKTYLKARPVLSENPNESPQSARAVRGTLSEGTGLEERDSSSSGLLSGSFSDVPPREGGLGGVPRVGDRGREPVALNSAESVTCHASGVTCHAVSGDPLADLATRTGGLVTAYQFEVALADQGRDAGEVLAAWDDLAATRDDGGLDFLFREARKKPIHGNILAVHILKTIPREVTNAPDNPNPRRLEVDP